MSSTLVKGTGWTGGTTAGVSITQYTFNPSSVSFPAANNVTVTWTNNDGVAHTVTSDTALFDSGNLNGGMTFVMTFPTPGTYKYHCAYHPYMTGTITVN
jgi:plastocyanin